MLPSISGCRCAEVTLSLGGIVVLLCIRPLLDKYSTSAYAFIEIDSCFYGNWGSWFHSNPDWSVGDQTSHSWCRWYALVSRHCSIHLPLHRNPALRVGDQTFLSIHSSSVLISKQRCIHDNMNLVCIWSTYTFRHCFFIPWISLSSQIMNLKGLSRGLTRI